MNFQPTRNINPSPKDQDCESVSLQRFIWAGVIGACSVCATVSGLILGIAYYVQASMIIDFNRRIDHLVSLAVLLVIAGFVGGLISIRMGKSSGAWQVNRGLLSRLFKFAAYSSTIVSGACVLAMLAYIVFMIFVVGLASLLPKWTPY